jgi:DNA-directed RNA polymerase subunit RPC12/RpoP
MNRECCGHWLPALGVYRCLLDSKMVALKEKPEACPNCGRKVLCSTLRKPKMREVVQAQVYLPGFGWVNFAERTICPKQ